MLLKQKIRLGQAKRLSLPAALLLCLSPCLADHIFFVEPFDFHYPDEEAYAEIGTSVHIKVSRGEYEPGTFIFLADSDRSDVRLYASDLRGPAGSRLPAGFLKLGVVAYMDRNRIREFLDDVWIGGLKAGAGKSGDSRGFNQDSKDRLPVLPAAIVPDEVEFEARQAQAVGHITLTADRLIAERGMAEERSRFESLLEDFTLLDKDGDRYDFRNPNEEVRKTRWAIIDLLAEILGPGDYGEGPQDKSAPRRR